MKEVEPGESERGSQGREQGRALEIKDRDQRGVETEEDPRLSVTDLGFSHGLSHVGLCETPRYLEAR